MFKYYGYSGKRFQKEDLMKTLEILSSDSIQKKLGINFYSDSKGTGFKTFIDGCCCFIFSDSVGAKKIKSYKEFDITTLDSTPNVYDLLVSDYEDEWRLLGDVSTSYIVGIGLPINQIQVYDWNSDFTAKSALEEIFAIANQRGLDIVDSTKIKEYEEKKSIATNRICEFSLENILNGSLGSNYFYHGIVSREHTLDKMLGVLTTGGIKCKRLLNMVNAGCNGEDYVSVCKKYPEKFYREEETSTGCLKEELSGFYGYVFNHFCFIISDAIPAVKVGLMDIPQNSLDTNSNMKLSDMFDEWQVESEIPLSNIVGIGIPLRILNDNSTKIQLSDYDKIRKIVDIAENLGLDIVDSSDPHFVEDYETKKEAGKRIVIEVNI